MKRQPYFYRSILAAIAATVAGMDFSAGAAMLPTTDSAAPAPSAVFNPATLSPAYGTTLLVLSGTASPAYIGTSNPGGIGNSSTITTSGYLTPTLLNNIAPGNASDGMVNITGFGKVQGLIVAAAISVSDRGNAALHTPSAMQIGDIAFDLSTDGVAGPVAIAEPFNGNTSGTLQHDNPAAYTLLTNANAAAGGQPFSLALLVSDDYGTVPIPPLAVGFNFSSETVDLITAVEVTDIGVVPEPAGTTLLLLGGLPLLSRRRRRRPRAPARMIEGLERRTLLSASDLAATVPIVIEGYAPTEMASPTDITPLPAAAMAAQPRRFGKKLIPKNRTPIPNKPHWRHNFAGGRVGYFGLIYP